MLSPFASEISTFSLSAPYFVTFFSIFILPVFLVLGCSACQSPEHARSIIPIDGDEDQNYNIDGKNRRSRGKNINSSYRNKNKENFMLEEEITSLSSFSLSFSNPSVIKREENTITYSNQNKSSEEENGENSNDQNSENTNESKWESCIVGEEMKNGFFRLNFKKTGQTCVYLVDSSSASLSSGQTFSETNEGAGLVGTPSNWIYIINSNNIITSMLCPYDEEEEISIEIDLRSIDPLKRNAYFFFDQEQQMNSLRGLPESIKIGV